MDGIFNPNKLTEELRAAGLPVAGVSSAGRVDYSRNLTKKEQDIVTAIIDAHDPSLSDPDVQFSLFSKAGVSLQEMVMALWKKVVKEDGSAISALVERVGLARSELNHQL